MKKRKVMIVLEDTGLNDGRHFNLYLDGDVERITETPDDQLSPSEYYGKFLMHLCIGALKEANVIQTIKPMDRSKH